MRKGFVLTILMVLGLLLVACGGTATPTEAPETGGTEPTAVAEEVTPEAEAEVEETPEMGGEMGTMEPIKTVCLVTDLGNVNDGTFNEFAYNGALQAVEDFGLELNFIETQSETDYETNINNCLTEGYDAIVTVGFLLADATHIAATENPETYFIGVDQFFVDRPLPNLVGIQFREDQGGFLAGSLACMMTQSDVVGGVYGMEIPPVAKFRTGFENGCRYVNPEATVLGAFIPSFTDPAAGQSTAQQFMGESADVIFGAGGPTGSGGIRAAAEQGIFVIGVDQDEYFTTFGGGSAPGADKLISSALKRVDVGVYDQLEGLADPSSGMWAGGDKGSIYVLDASNGGISYAPFHDAEADVPDAVKTRIEEIREALADGSLLTGVDAVTGGPDEATIPDPVPFEE